MNRNVFWIGPVALVGLISVGFAPAEAATKAAAKTHASTSAAAVLVAQNRATASKLLFGLYLGGLLTATLLAGIALWRSNAVHRGVAALFVVGLVLAASSPPSVIALPLLLPFVLAAVLLAKRIWDVAAVTTEASRIDQPA